MFSFAFQRLFLTVRCFVLLCWYCIGVLHATSGVNNTPLRIVTSLSSMVSPPAGLVSIQRSASSTANAAVTTSNSGGRTTAHILPNQTGMLAGAINIIGKKEFVIKLMEAFIGEERRAGSFG